jgi:hypothetical protein
LDIMRKKSVNSFQEKCGNFSGCNGDQLNILPRAAGQRDRYLVPSGITL